MTLYDRAVLNTLTSEWRCKAVASHLASADTPGPGRLGTHHGVIYVCGEHQAAAEAQIRAAGYNAETNPAPAGHQWDPWPCGFITAYSVPASAALTGAAPVDVPEDWTSEYLLEHVRALAAAVAKGRTEHAPNLAAAARVLQYRYDSPRFQGQRGPRPDSGLPDVDLMRRVSYEGNGFLAVTVEELRAAVGRRSLAGLNLCTIPADLPAEETAPVVVFNGLAGVASLVGRIARGEDPSGAYADVHDRAVLNRPPYEEF